MDPNSRTSTPPDEEASLEDLRRRLDVRSHVLELSFALGKAVSAELEMEPLCDLVVERIGGVFRVEALSLDFLEESSRTLVAKRQLGERARVAALRARAVEALAAEALVDAPRAAAVPLVAERKVKGVLALGWSAGEPRPTREDRHLLEVLAGTIASAIDNAWLYSQIQRLNERLEEKVRDRTAELESALADLRRAQAELVEREKMASLGQLTAGIAHEINNPLAYVISNVALARERTRAWQRYAMSWGALARVERATDPREVVAAVQGFVDAWCADDKYRGHAADFRQELATLSGDDAAALASRFLRYVQAREARDVGDDGAAAAIDPLLASAEQGLERVKRIVLDLRAFSRLDAAEQADVDLDAEIDLTLSILAHLAKERGVHLARRRGMRAAYRCHPARLGQVVLNLVTNALQATEAGGAVGVETRDDEQGVAIVVRDTGSGIEPAALGRVFDPFFTTKPPGQGVGLGLSISYRIVQEHGGRIDVESRPGEGTSFTVRLPPRGARTPDQEDV